MPFGSLSIGKNQHNKSVTVEKENILTKGYLKYFIQTNVSKIHTLHDIKLKQEFKVNENQQVRTLNQ